MRNYLYRLKDAKVNKTIVLDEKPSIGELILPNPLAQRKQYFEVIQIIHSHGEHTLLIVQPFDFKKLC